MKQLTILILATLMVSCGTTNKSKKTAQNPIQNKWELSLLDGKQVSSNQPIYIELTDDNKVSGFIGCNRISGNYEVKNNSQVKFNQLATTRMSCSPNEMALESEVLELLNTANNFTIENKKLMLNIGRRAPLAIFCEMSSNEIVNKYWKLIKLEGKPVTIAKNQEKEQYFQLNSSGVITGFAGCNFFNGQYELSAGNKIRFNENMAVTMKICPDVDVQESDFLKVFQLADNYTINGDTLELNVGRRAPLAVFEAVYF